MPLMSANPQMITNTIKIKTFQIFLNKTKRFSELFLYYSYCFNQF